MDLTDTAVRARIGLSRVAVAKLAGVDRQTVVLYEASPALVGSRLPEKREALEWVYGALRSLLASAPGHRG